MVAVEAATAAEAPIRVEAKAAAAAPEAEVKGDAAVAAAAGEAEVEPVYKSDLRKLEELMSKLNPGAQEFVPSSRRTAPVAVPLPAAGGGVLSADAPVFVSAAEYYAATGGRLEISAVAVGGGGGRDSSSDGSSNGGGGGHPLNRRVGEL